MCLASGMRTRDLAKETAAHCDEVRRRVHHVGDLMNHANAMFDRPYTVENRGWWSSYIRPKPLLDGFKVSLQPLPPIHRGALGDVLICSGSSSAQSSQSWNDCEAWLVYWSATTTDALMFRQALHPPSEWFAARTRIMFVLLLYAMQLSSRVYDFLNECLYRIRHSTISNDSN